MQVKNAIELVRMILDGHAKIITETKRPFFERALENMLVRFKEIALH